MMENFDDYHRLKVTEHMITCGICFRVITKAVTLPCGDSFCYKCIHSKVSKPQKIPFCCPVCSRPYTEYGTRYIHKHLNTDLDNYITMLSHGTFGQAMCRWCEGAAAVKQCDQCACIFCSDCSMAVHKRAPKKSHIVFSLNDSYRSYFRRCLRKDHEEYKAEFYCVQCEDMCCAYCLQVGPHREHRHISARTAAAEARQQMLNNIHWLTQSKAKVESQCLELNRLTALYAETYDNVETLITERFESYHQQLTQQELEVRKVLATLRESGDTKMTTTRKQYLNKVNTINEGSLRFVCLQKSGADYEVLESRAQLGAQLQGELPTVTGTGFKAVSMGDMVIGGINVQLDLNEFIAPMPIVQSTTVTHTEPVAADTTNFCVCRSQMKNQLIPPIPVITETAISRMQQPPVQPVCSNHAQITQPTPRTDGAVTTYFNSALIRPLRLSFPIDENIEATTRPNGILLRSVATGDATQIGIRSKETFDKVVRNFPKDGGIVTWQVMLENIVNSFVGIVEKTPAPSAHEGFYWKPRSKHVVDGKLGKMTPVVQRLPTCRNGDVVRFVFDCDRGTLRIAVNNKYDYGIVLTNVSSHVAACFILFSGESLTVLY